MSQSAQSPGFMLDQLEKLVSCESPTGSIAHLHDCADLIASMGEAVLGRPPQRVIRDGVPHLLWAAPQQHVLLLGHFDTVWPAGTIDEWPFGVDGTIATGPGVCDMKAGIVQIFAALSRMPDPSRVGLLLTGDEEAGSATSRELLEAEALRSRSVLVCEPSTPEGALKVARKGGAMYTVTAHGRAAHAGVEPHLGVNATIELAHQVLALQALASAPDGTSVTPTVLAAGTTSNTVPEIATLCVDVRAWTRAELDRVDKLMRGLTARLPESILSVEPSAGRPPLDAAVSMPLFDIAMHVAKEMNLSMPEGAYAAGASDGNFTGALGVPTLDGLGAVGGLAHARGEYVDVAMMSERAAFLATLVDRLP